MIDFPILIHYDLFAARERVYHSCHPRRREGRWPKMPSIWRFICRLFVLAFGFSVYAFDPASAEFQFVEEHSWLQPLV